MYNPLVLLVHTGSSSTTAADALDSRPWISSSERSLFIIVVDIVTTTYLVVVIAEHYELQLTSLSVATPPQPETRIATTHCNVM